ncbi:recombinase family protein [Microbacterium sp. VKM Ac-2923]|uniref:recombinase family protein n=1 Tax=Microbacterium sp. VKM Ac-2923 TaxID=2929476 RepID=UPI001FB3ADF8|nr:recombinase family protein [Microbacterium sp. VKM Ac-2923]MCJ1707943.1 recombinase family protein [Microbacterium sp. VKM Ac-2923]
MAPTRVVGYVRLSRESADSTSVARQRQIIEAHAKGRGWELVDTIDDVDVSASKRRLDRPGLTRVRALIAGGKAEAVLVWRLDRLARSVVDFGTLLDDGLNVVSCTEPLDTTTAMGRAMAEVLQVFAALESRTIGDRLRSTIAYRVGQGDRWRGGPTPYGYKSVPHPSGDGKTLAIDATEAAYVRQAAEIVLSGGSLYKAMTTLTSNGSTPRRATAWSLSSLRVVLTGDSVLGRQSRHGAPLRDDTGVIATPWEPILTVSDAERLRAVLQARPLATTRRKASRLLSGLLTCESCGSRLRVNSRRAQGAQVESYGCRANGDGKVCPRPASINADQVEAFLVGEFLSVAGRLTVVERRAVVRDVIGLAEVEEAIRHTTDAMREPGADIPALVERLSALTGSRNELAARPVEPVIETVETGETYGERWERSDTNERRAALESVLMGPVPVVAIGRGYRRVDADRVLAPWPWLDEYAAQYVDPGWTDARPLVAPWAPLDPSGVGPEIDPDWSG